uniref:BTB domain-containing protein n=1 Tax=Panagrolaimus sp. PS1159 TaxID=55785 RepID=A0AC35GIS6_9BILA
MFRKFEFVKIVRPSENLETIVKFADNIEFTLQRETNFHQIKNIKGDFEITKITESYWNYCYSHGCYCDDGTYDYGCSGSYEDTSDIKLDKSSNEFSSTRDYSKLTFNITANIELKEINEEMCAVKYQLLIPSDCLQRLKVYEYFKKEFVLSGYDVLKFTYNVKKINESKENDIEIHIENPYDVEIQGKKGDFLIIKSSENTVDLLLSFYFSLNILDLKVVSVKDADQSYIIDGSEICQLTEHSAIDESRPESVFSSTASKLFKIGTNCRYADVNFIASDGEMIPSHRCILVEFSDMFSAIFEESTEIPVQITADDFDAETIQSALNFLYEKSDAINGKEMEVFKFAIKFGI